MTRNFFECNNEFVTLAKIAAHKNVNSSYTEEQKSSTEYNCDIFNETVQIGPINNQ